VHDAAYGGNSLCRNDLAPTGPMPTLRGRMIGFRCRCNKIGTDPKIKIGSAFSLRQHGCRNYSDGLDGLLRWGNQH
jgi:hypothetical protein